MTRGRSRHMLGANVGDLPSWSAGYRAGQFGEQLQQVLNTVALAMDQDDCDRVFRKVLLEREVLVNGNEDIKLGLRQSEKLAV